jgi:ABC-2 type transport system permease protein
MSGALAPTGRPGPAPAAQMVAAHARLELAQLLRNGEQLLLTLVIPTVLLVVLVKVDVVDVGAGPRVDFVLPGVLALAVLSTAFTAQAIATGFERRYGVLKRLGTTPLTRGDLLAGKTVAVLAVELVQVVVLVVVGVLLGWRPAGVGVAAAVALLLLGTVAFSGLALLMAGTLRAEATLAAANLVYVLLLLGSGIVVPLSRFGAGTQHVLQWLPSTALADGLRASLTGAAVPGRVWLVLAVWSVAAVAAAARWFRWE